MPVASFIRGALEVLVSHPMLAGWYSIVHVICPKSAYDKNCMCSFRMSFLYDFLQSVQVRIVYSLCRLWLQCNKFYISNTGWSLHYEHMKALYFTMKSSFINLLIKTTHPWKKINGNMEILHVNTKGQQPDTRNN